MTINNSKTMRRNHSMCLCQWKRPYACCSLLPPTLACTFTPFNDHLACDEARVFFVCSSNLNRRAKMAKKPDGSSGRGWDSHTRIDIHRHTHTHTHAPDDGWWWWWWKKHSIELTSETSTMFCYLYQPHTYIHTHTQKLDNTINNRTQVW